MAVETVLGVNIAARRDAAPVKTVDPQNYFGRLRILQDRGVLPASSSINSTIDMGEIPWDAVISMRSVMAYDALAASTTLSVGIRGDAAIGFTEDDDLLVAAQSSASAGSVSLLAAVNIDKTGLKLWQLAGLTAPPPPLSRARIFATLKGAAGAGDVAWEFQFAVD